MGIIGGFGPETTAAFQLKIVELCAAQKQRTRPAILMWNTPIPVQIENDLILKGESMNKFLPFLISAAKLLENAGADFLVMPCNTLHVFIHDIRRAVSIPVLSILDETALSLKTNDVTSIGLIGTDISRKQQLHAKKLRSFGIKTILPTNDEQQSINLAIHNILNQKDVEKTKKGLTVIAESFLRKNIQDILLACTDLQILFPNIQGITVHDTMDILAHATVREMTRNV